MIDVFRPIFSVFGFICRLCENIMWANGWKKKLIYSSRYHHATFRALRLGNFLIFVWKTKRLRRCGFSRSRYANFKPIYNQWNTYKFQTFDVFVIYIRNGFTYSPEYMFGISEIYIHADIYSSADRRKKKFDLCFGDKFDAFRKISTVSVLIFDFCMTFIKRFI